MMLARLFCAALCALVLCGSTVATVAAPTPNPESAPVVAVVRIPPPFVVVTPIAQRPAFVLSGEVIGTYQNGLNGPIGEYTAYGSTLAEAYQNAQKLEQEIRMTATAQAVRP